MNVEPTTTSSFGSRLLRAFFNLLRLLLILAIVIGIGAAIYFGAPYLYEKLILPVETNTARLVELERGQQTERQQLSAQISELTSRLNTLENRQTAAAQTLADLQGAVQVLETTLGAHSAALDQLAQIHDTLARLAETTDRYGALISGDGSLLAELQRQITISRSIELLSRGRLYLSQSNYGLAEQDLRQASDLLSDLRNALLPTNIEALDAVLWRLDLAMENLPAFPVIAVDDLDIAWQLLIENLPAASDALAADQADPGTAALPTPAP